MFYERYKLTLMTIDDNWWHWWWLTTFDDWWPLMMTDDDWWQLILDSYKSMIIFVCHLTFKRFLLVLYWELPLRWPVVTRVHDTYPCWSEVQGHLLLILIFLLSLDKDCCWWLLWLWLPIWISFFNWDS